MTKMIRSEEFEKSCQAIKIEDIDIKQEDLHDCIDVKQETSNNESQWEQEDLDIKLESLHHSIDIKEENSNDESQLDQDDTQLESGEKRKRRWWVRESNQDRNESGYYNKTYKKMKDTDPDEFFEHTRMTREVYDVLLSLMKDRLTKKSMIDFECSLAVTLTYLSRGVSHQVLAWSYQMGKSTVRDIVLDTCAMLWEVLSPLYVCPPDVENFKDISEKFCTQWNMPNCVGAIDGKHINIQRPSNSSPMSNFSILLLAICDANYCFTHVDVGGHGSQNIGGIIKNSPAGHSLLSGEFLLPVDENLPNTDKNFPFYFVGDTAFPLKRHIMRPFSGRSLDETKLVFNYRLSRVRRVIDNCFGILVARWRILTTTLPCSATNAGKISLACIALHNFIMSTCQSKVYCPPNFADWEDDAGNIHLGEWRNEANPLWQAKFDSSNATRGAFELRETLANYFMTEGVVNFQFDRVNTSKNKT